MERSSFKLLAVWAKGKEINIGRKFAGEKKNFIQVLIKETARFYDKVFIKKIV